MTTHTVGEGGLVLQELTRRFGDQVAVDHVSVSVADGELLALIGASGSGKTTTLRIVAGYEPPDSGRVLLDGRDITRVPPQHREFGMVFQHYALFPHLSIEENVAFGLEARGMPRRERRAKAVEALAMVGLTTVRTRPIQSLSGGEQQRVALARALVIQPRALLLDEPLSNLDPTLRETMRDELRGTLRRVGVTALFVTHDQEDAFAIADRVAIMERGRLLQVGSPEQLYREPASRAVAAFVGRATILPAADRDGHAVVRVAAREMVIDRPPPAGEGALSAVVRPEALSITPPEAEGAWGGVVRGRRFAGAVTYASVELDESTVVEVATRDVLVNVGDRVGVRLDPRAISLVRG